jgi:hypothetical protein
MPSRPAIAVVALVLLAAFRLSGQTVAEPSAIVAAIQAEALHRSQAMEWTRGLAVAPRLTGSPALDRAGAWLAKQLQKLGLVNTRFERWPFERRWTVQSSGLWLDSIDAEPLVAVPQTWSPGTDGSAVGPLRVVHLTPDARFGRYRGQLRGAYVLVKVAPAVPIALENQFQEFLRAEGVAATLEASRGADASVAYVRTGHTPEQDGRLLLVPALSVSADDLHRLEQLAATGVDLHLRGEIAVAEAPGGPEAGFNIVSEIRGTHQPDEVVLLGAHLDSVHPAQGAADNASGCAVVLDAVRAILAAGARPRRTIRVAFWGGEEQGRLGSRVYAQQHVFDQVTKTRRPGWTHTVVYINLDGASRIKGVILQGNGAARAHVERWLTAVRDLGVDAIFPGVTSGSDHVTFREIGVPTLTFLANRLNDGRIHHSTADTIDEVQDDDLRQAAAVAASLTYLAATADRLPGPAVASQR